MAMLLAIYIAVHVLAMQCFFIDTVFSCRVETGGRIFRRLTMQFNGRTFRYGDYFRKDVSVLVRNFRLANTGSFTCKAFFFDSENWPTRTISAGYLHVVSKLSIHHFHSK